MTAQFKQKHGESLREGLLDTTNPMQRPQDKQPVPGDNQPMQQTTPVHVTARICARPDTYTRLRRELIALMAPTRSEAGCLRYDLYEHSGQPGEFLFIEQWQTTDDLERHLQQPHIQHFLAASADLLAEPIQIAQWQPID